LGLALRFGWRFTLSLGGRKTEEKRMNGWIVIVDMDQPGNRMAVSLEGDDEFSCATFESLAEIEKLQTQHLLGVFTWWAFNFVTGELEELWGKPRKD
jgi:hypothetical protein